MNKISFTSLTPEALEKNETIYDSALDEAFSNKNIKNIAITGIYGSGKSTVWETYKKGRNLGDVITVSLGKYDDDSLDNIQDNIENHKNEDNIGEIDNNLERQLINQITAQVDNKSIPLSKYQYRDNKKTWVTFLEVTLIIIFLSSIIFWKYRVEIFAKLMNDRLKIMMSIFMVISFFAPIFYVFWGIVKRKRIPFSRIKFGNSEANLDEKLNEDETVLDRDIRELVYILYNSQCNIVVFEDLDRYNHLDIYKKLRELNYLLNSFIATKKEDRIVRFIYMLKDGLFYSKNRTKFFDFIVPIIPIVNSRNSENKLLELFKDQENSPSERTISNISLYVDDMRLLKNIYNEYNIYYNIIAMKDLELSNDKLFSLVVLKNIFPKEFDMLQQDQGYIYDLLKNKDLYKSELIEHKTIELEKLSERIEYLDSCIDKTKFELMEKYLPAYVRLYNMENVTWAQKLEKWSKKPEETFYINYLSSGANQQNMAFNYEEFLERFIYKNKEAKETIENFPNNKNIEKENLISKRNKIREEILQIKLWSLSKTIQNLTPEKREQIFMNTENNIIDSHYFPLIKYLILEGLIDETYWHYKGYFYDNSLGKNDTLFLKNILEGNKQDIYMKLENPLRVLKRLHQDDFSRDNILNLDLMEECLLKNKAKEISSITRSSMKFDNLDMLTAVLSNFQKNDKTNLLDVFIKIMFFNSADTLQIVMSYIEKEEPKLFRTMIILLFSQETLNDAIELFREMIENHVESIIILEKGNGQKFFENLTDKNIKFQYFKDVKIPKEYINEIVKRVLYKLSLNNIHYLVNELLEKNIGTPTLIQLIYERKELEDIKKNIDDHFNDFIMEYIDESHENGFKNNEETVLRIVNSQISNSYKKQYLENSSVKLNNLSDIKNIEEFVEENLVVALFEKNTLEFKSENLDFYLENNGKINKEFLQFLERNIQAEKRTVSESVVCGSPLLCNQLIGFSDISKKLFDRAIIGANQPLKVLTEMIPEDRLLSIINHDLLEVNESNIEKIIDRKFVLSLTNITNKKCKEVIDIIISDSQLVSKLDLRTIYSLINNVDNEECIIELIMLLEEDLNVSEINFEKEKILRYVIGKKISIKDIQFIINKFDEFPLKIEFLTILQETIKFDELKFEWLSVSFVNYIMKTDEITNENKILLLITIISNSNKTSDFTQYLDHVKGLGDLPNVFNGGRPEIDTTEKEIVAKALLEKKYVKKRKPNRIEIR